MIVDASQAVQLQVAMAAVEDGTLESDTLLRAVAEWLSGTSPDLCAALLTRPELSDQSRQSIRSRFASLQTGPLQVEHAKGVQLGEQELARLRQLLREGDESASEEVLSSTPDDEEPSTLDYRANQPAQPGDEPTQPFVSTIAKSKTGPGSAWRLDDFEILREFKRGGLGVLYLARDKRLQREVVLKKILPKYAHSDELREKFVLEAEVTGQLEHPSIVPIYVMGSDEHSEPYYAMRLIGGENLRDNIHALHATRKPGERFFDGRQFREMLQRFIDICLAIEYAHSRNVIHRDLKPANIMLGSHGETLVIDWGLAKWLRAAGREIAEQTTTIQTPSTAELRLSGPTLETEMGGFAGTIRYAAPEQLAGDIDKIGPACDIYSLGVILFELLCNRQALEGDVFTREQALAKIEAGQLRTRLQLTRVCLGH